MSILDKPAAVPADGGAPEPGAGGDADAGGGAGTGGDAGAAGDEGAGGLTHEQAAARLAQAGPNALPQQALRSPWRMLLAQFVSPVIGLLLCAAIVSAALGQLFDAIAIGAILVINGMVGFFQEYRAEQAMAALRTLTAPRARVSRQGQALMIAAADVVPGDLLLLEAGDIVAADARLLEAYALQANEAPLTGESSAAEKSHGPDRPGAPLAERSNQVFMGTHISSGSGVARVFATGAGTELGKIAHLLATASDGGTPLQERMAAVTRLLIWLCLGVVVLVALIGLARGIAWQQVFVSAVSLAVAAVPEGLPAVVTIALALGVKRMAARNVLVRRLHAIETIGCATVVCTDKTGTLTTGVMAVRQLWSGDEHALLFAAAACCDAQLDADGRAGAGDPTELALLLAALERGIRREHIERDFPKVGAIPFDPVRKRMAVWRANGVLYVKGAPERVLELCTTVPAGAEQAATDMAGRGLRVLAVATGRSEREQDLVLLGLVGMADPPRQEAIDAVADARQAGVRVVMITGDHPATAYAIAGELGIVAAGESADGRVHARATPQDKIDIVRQWKARGAIVAMTGDGVNDAPALREAHIGIAMGRTGTEVTRGAADIILADDNFASIIAALKEGRGIFDNIRKTVAYLLAGNAAELAVMLVASLLALPVPLLPLQLLWINLVTDSLPALALVAERTEDDVTRRPPRHPGEALLRRREWTGVAAIGILQASITLAVFWWALQARGLDEARNLAFTTLVFGELFRAFGARSATKTCWQLGMTSNAPLLMVVAASVAAQFAIHQLPGVQQMLHIGALQWQDGVIALLIGLIPLLLIEGWKLAARTMRR